MNIDDYENQNERQYEDLAAAVELILKKAIKDAADQGVPRLQSSQSRAKQARSLRPKLAKRGLIGSDRIEMLIKDLAGVRLIFYTDVDVDRFLTSRLIPQLFEVEWREAKIHHPNPENDNTPYEATHYVVRLNPEMLVQPEYTQFAGMRCEIQIQTMLSHIWAETSHNIVYKPEETQGFGTAEMEYIKKRLHKILRTYLVPAGHEFVKVQHDYERLTQGKKLFDRGPLETLAKSRDNNERRDTLTIIKDDVIRNFDDLFGIYPEVCRALLDAVRAARQTEPVEIPTELGNLPGATAAHIAELAVRIFSEFCYVNVEQSFLTLAGIDRDETDSYVRKHVADAIERLARHNLDAWRRAGPFVQFVLTDLLGGMSADQIDALRPLALIVWEEAVGTELRGFSVAAEQMTFSAGAVLASDELKALRQKALHGLFGLFDRSTTLSQQVRVLAAIEHGGSMPTQGRAANELYALVLADTDRIVKGIDERAQSLPHELVRRIEQWLLTHYQRYKQIAQEPEDRFGCRAEAQALVAAVKSLRDRINANMVYVRYKTLIGFQSVFPPHWNNDVFDYTGAEAYREARLNEYVADVSPTTEGAWSAQIALCAATKSDDSSTYTAFCDFLRKVSAAKPEIMLRYIERADENVLSFLPAMLNGLSASTASAAYDALIAHYLATSSHLTAIAQHFGRLTSPDIAKVKVLLAQAIAANEGWAVKECIAMAVQSYAASPAWTAEIFAPAVRHLTATGDYGWANRVWFMPPLPAFAAQLSPEQVQLGLDSLLPAPRVDTHMEIVLTRIAAHHLAAVWAFFGKRLARPKAEGEDYDFVPFELHYLDKQLVRNIALAIDTVRGWYDPSDGLFQYNGGRLLYAALPNFTDEVSVKFCDLARTGTDKDLDFMLEVLPNYRGKADIHAALMEIANRLPEGDARREKLALCIETTGVVSGAFGLVDAHRAIKAALKLWLEDSRPGVKAFALECTRRLNQRIAAEQRDAERRQQQRRLDFDTDDAPNGA